MDRIDKLKAISATKADAAADIGLINRYSMRELKPEEVYCFSLHLCDNDVDRDLERFTDTTLGDLGQLFLGKTGIMDHNWSAEKQVARIYRTEVVETGERNSLGEPLKILRASAYMLRNESNQPLIDAIDGGILKEVSVGCAIETLSCSICGEPQRYNWHTGKYQCENGHIRSETYDKKMCVGNLDGARDAYEFSFVAVPAQRKAGVTKSVANLDDAFQTLMESDLSGCADKIISLQPRLQAALVSEKERAKRAKILAENKKYLHKKH